MSLRRTPTRTGNRLKGTWSFWVKRNNLNGSSTSRYLFYADNGGSQANAVRFNDDDGGDSLRALFWNGTDNNAFINFDKLRDPSSWQHYLIVYDSTLSTFDNMSNNDQTLERIKIFVNGRRMIETGGNSTQNKGIVNPNQLMTTWGNAGSINALFATDTNSNGAFITTFDAFFVDGQALTPDVFGFYKDGDGYVSVGSTQATDFRPGQWVPKSPRTIKSEINRRGGFGVNGFYLPMNDSSNFGADFHTTPNSIITLKGEDLPQPRNGAPTTSDAYVSQLREETGSLGFDGVVKFDGSGDCLTVSDNVDFEFGSGNFTIEAFIYYIGSPGTGGDTYVIASKWDNQSAPNDKGFILRISDDGSGDNLQWYYTTDGSTNQVTTGSAILSPHRWYHIAFVRNGTTGTFYINGIADATTVSFGSNSIRDTGNAFRIGANLESGSIDQEFKGFISNLRVVKGTAVYTSNFTAPTEPLANVTNTKLLCCNSSTSATAATVTPGSITANGDAFATRNELTGSIVLGVAGISTATGSNLVTNGTFDTNTTGWTSQDATLSNDNGRLKVLTTNTNYGSALQTVTGLTVGKRYTFQVDMFYGNAALVTAISGASPSINSGWQSADYVWRTSFTATTTSLTIDFQMASQSNVYGFWDNAILKQEDAPLDYSADIKGSGSNRTPTVTGPVGVGYEIPSYYGSAINTTNAGDALYYNVDGSGSNAYGTGDFTFECWFYATEEPSNWGILMKHATNGSWANGITLTSKNNTSRQFTIYTQDGSSNVQTIGSLNYALNQWHHVVAERYNGQLTLYVNGVAEATREDTRNYAVAGTPASSEQYALSIGAQSGGNYQSNGYFQDVRVYRGVAKYKGGFDVSKPYTPVGIESWRQVPDNCKNNFATWNPLLGPQGCALASGNLTVTSDGANQHKGTRSTMGMSSGKWYWEYRVGTVAVNSYVGVSESMDPNGLPSTNYIVSGQGGNNYVSPNGSFSVTDSSLTTGMIIGCAFDRDASTQQLKVYKNGSLAVTGTSSDLGDGVLYLAHNSFNAAVSDGWEGNFGQNPTFSGTVTAGTYTDSNGKGLFKYQPPAGYLALCEDNLPTPAIADPGEHFKTVLWSGDSNSGRSITGVGFQPDLVWLKSRTNAASHRLSDSVRGVNKQLMTNTTEAEATFTTMLTSFDSDGFTLGDNVGINGSGYTNVAWCWKAGGAAVSNTDGSITSQVSVNQDAGFSIVSYTGTGSNATVGHGLNKTPKFIITKQRTTAGHHWRTYHSSIGATRSVYLDLTNAQSGVDAGFMNSTEPTTSVFSIGIDTNINESSQAHIAYCWAEIEGYSKFGSYEGSGNADGPFVYCGFKPAWVMVKNVDDTGGRNWGIQDSSRKSTNPCDKHLKADSAEVENSGLAGSTYQIDMLSNGFKVRNNTGIWNENNDTIIFMAFAESPFQTANAK